MSLLVPPVVSSPVDPQDLVRRKLGVAVKSSQLVGKDGFCSTHDVVLEDGRTVTLRLPNTRSLAPVVEAEAATLGYVADRTTIPVPKVLSYGPVDEDTDSGSVYMIFEKPAGVPADTVFSEMQPRQHDAFVAQLARWMVELFAHRFASIGSLGLSADPDRDQGPDAGSQLDSNSHSSYTVRPLVRRAFLADGRAQLALARGPFPSARAYYRACAQRERDCARTLLVQTARASAAYRESVEGGRAQVERCAALLEELVDRCGGLDEDEGEDEDGGGADGGGRFALDVHDVGLKNILVDPAEHSTITAITDWQFVGTRPLWCCARAPAWLRPSLACGGDDDARRTARLCAVFRSAAAAAAAPAFVRALDADGGARCTLDDLAEYDALRDGFLLLPALENILATLPGQEDVAGLTVLLDPSTLPGRVARITLLTRGSNALFLAMTPPKTPAKLPGPDADADQQQQPQQQPQPAVCLTAEGAVLVHATG